MNCGNRKLKKKEWMEQIKIKSEKMDLRCIKKSQKQKKSVLKDYPKN
jgi:hypothetical protein